MVLTTWKKASISPFTLEVRIADVFSAAALAVSIRGLDLGRGGDVVCVLIFPWLRHSKNNFLFFFLPSFQFKHVILTLMYC